MLLDGEAIEEFKILYLKEYGIELTTEEAIVYGGRLIGLVKAVYGAHLPKLKTIDMETNK